MKLTYKENRNGMNQPKSLARDTNATQPHVSASAAKPKHEATVTLEQWVEVTVKNGVTKTACFPSTEELRKMGAKMDPPYNIVYRRFHFVNCVPPEYYWITPREDRRRNGGAAIQRMTPETFDRISKEEAELGTGHLLATPFLARPEDRGTCNCDVCTRHREQDEKKAA
jgi:hypothetical protein